MGICKLKKCHFFLPVNIPIWLSRLHVTFLACYTVIKVYGLYHICIFCAIVYADVCSNVQSKYTEQLRNLPDLESLLPHFEERNIITFHQHVEIKNSNSPTEDRMKMLLDNISLPLQNGSTERFDSMLEIFTDHGADETKMIASSMQSEVQGTDLLCNQSIAIASYGMAYYIM